jgi:protein O-mannosyl-transferase
MGHTSEAREKNARHTAGPRGARRIGADRLLLALALAATFVVYVGTLRFDFVYDDHEQIVENFRIQSWRYVPGYFTEHLWSHLSPKDPGNFYRPLFLLWLRLNHLAFGVRPAGWHFTTVLLHLGVTLLVYLLARRLLNDRGSAGLAALIFGIHPVHLEAVAWVAGATEPLLGLFFLSSFLCYLKRREGGRRRRLWGASSLVLFALALLAKETAIALPFLVLAWEWIFGRAAGEPASLATARSTSEQKAPLMMTAPLRSLGRLAVVLAPYVALSAAYLALRLRVLKELSHAFTPLPFHTLLLTAPSLLWFYFRNLIWPSGASAFYDLPYVTAPGLSQFWIPAAAVAVAAMGLAWWSRHSRAIAFASLWMLVPILPVLDVRVFPEGDIVHDRYLYLPSVGLAIIAACAVVRLKAALPKWLGRQATQAAAVIGLTLLVGFGAVEQSLSWADDLVLSYRGIRVAPRSVYAVNNLANAMLARGHPDQAIGLYEKALRLRPNFWESNYNLGLVHYKAGHLEDSERYLNRAIQINPFDPREFVCLGFARLEAGRAEEAAALMRYAIELRPDAANSHMALGVVLKAQGRLEAALEEFKQASALEPERASARAQIAEIEVRLRNSPGSGASGDEAQPKH